MKIGLLSDLHLGGRGEDRWHNRQLLGGAEELTRAAVDLLNRQKLDRVIVLGDITNDGTERQLALALRVLEELVVPWHVVPGNHDAPLVQSGALARLFHGHVPAPYVADERMGMLFLRQKLSATGEAEEIALDRTYLAPGLHRLAEDKPPVLWVFSHFQLVSEELYAGQHDGLYAGHYADGPQLLALLRNLVPGSILSFCGHQHWHHRIETPECLQCTTGAIVEYPMEARIVSLRGHSLSVSTLETASSAAAQESLTGASWTAGSAEDRSFQVRV